MLQPTATPARWITITRIGAEWWYSRVKLVPVCNATPLTEAVSAFLNALDADDTGGGELTELATTRTAARRPDPSAPGRVLAWLRAELAALGLDAPGMIVTGRAGTLALAGGTAVGYRDGWLFWPAGRLSQGGRPLYAIHQASDAPGAARRRPPAGHAPDSRQPSCSPQRATRPTRRVLARARWPESLGRLSPWLSLNEYPGVSPMSDSENVAAMRRELGRQLAALRREAGLTQDGRAALAGFSRSTVSVAEIGRQAQAAGFWEACDKALDTGGVLAAGAGQVEAVRDAEQRAAARTAQEAREARAMAALTAAAERSGVTAGVTAVQPCPNCGREVTVLTTLIPDTPARAPR